MSFEISGITNFVTMSNKTIIYYTGNTEKLAFENKVMENIMDITDLEIISVSQKPIDFGTNICVGDIGKNYGNAFLQARLGCLRAKTEFVMMTESDCLYPEGYFDFEPTDKDVIYTYDNVWLMWDRHNRTRFYKHGTTCGSIVLGRELYLSMLKDGMPDFFKPDIKWEYFTGPPLINIKTRNGVSFGTQLTKGVKPKKSFPEWGTVEDVKHKYQI